MPNTPAEVITTFSRCLESGDLDGAYALYEPEAAFQAEADGPALTGAGPIREALSGLIALRPTMTGDFVRVHEAGDTALVVYRWRMTGTLPGGERVEQEGTSADVMRRRADGTWSILIDDPWGGAGQG